MLSLWYNVKMSLQNELSQKAWKLREEGKIVAALAIWTKLYYSYIESKDWAFAIDTLVDISICWKIQFDVKRKEEYINCALATLNHIKYLSESTNTELRDDYNYHLAGVQVAAKEYEHAVTSFEQYLAGAKTPQEEANIKAAIGYSKACLGEREEGVKVLRESVAMFESSQEHKDFQGKDVYLIWKLGAQLKLAESLTMENPNAEDKKEAYELTKSILTEAKEHGLGARAKQAKTLLEKLQN